MRLWLKAVKCQGETCVKGASDNGIHIPVHAWQISPEVTCPVSRRNLNGIDHDRVTL